MYKEISNDRGRFFQAIAESLNDMEQIRESAQRMIDFRNMIVPSIGQNQIESSEDKKESEASEKSETEE